MNRVDEQTLKEIIAFAVKHPKKLAKTINVQHDHPRIYEHKKPVTLVIIENESNVIKSRAEVHCGDCDEKLYSFGIDDIAHAVANAKLVGCYVCGNPVQMTEISQDGMQYIKMHCQNKKCGITSDMHTSTVSNDGDFSVIERHQKRMKVVDRWNGSSTKVSTKKKFQSTEA